MNKTVDETVAVQDNPYTVEIRDQKHQLSWYFSKEDETLLSDHRAITFSKVEVDGQALKPIRDYPLSEIPDRIENGLREHGFRVVG